MPHTEKSVNTVLANILRPMFARATVAGEDTGSVIENPALQLDVLITAPGRSPVSIETEFMPARTVEDDALSRLGKTARRDAKTIEAAIAVRYPERLRNDDLDINDELQENRLFYAVFTQEGLTNDIRTVRFPETGWIEGEVGDLADLARLVSVSQRAVNDATRMLMDGIGDAAKVMDLLDNQRAQINRDVAKALGMMNVSQTRRMACAIIANAMIFHERIVGMHTYSNVRNLQNVAGPGVQNPQRDLISAWQEILRINYYPIFGVAIQVLSLLPGDAAGQVIETLRDTAQSVTQTGINNAHDLTGRVFQRLISDRKYLATFYTLPASAALLSHLAIAKMANRDWSASEHIAPLRIADFACGTGALLSAVYDQIATRYEHSGGDPASLHKKMMEDVLTGCDVLPSAVHITGSTLSGFEPNIGFEKANLYTMPYARQNGGAAMIGSLELLQASQAFMRMNMSDPSVGSQTSSIGEQPVQELIAEFPDESYDLIIMNPPFTSNTKHYDSEEGVLDAGFAAFDASVEEQAEMAAKLREYAEGTVYHGHAGLGSAFVALAKNKLKVGGIAAFVLPFTAMNGASWRRFRETIASRFEDVTVVSISANGRDMSFSSETGIAECLVICRKSSNGTKSSQMATFVTLQARPRHLAESQEVARAILMQGAPRRLDDGPFGGTPIVIGDQHVGDVLLAPIVNEARGWSCGRITDYSVAQTAHMLAGGALWLPAESEPLDIPVAPLGSVGQRGLDSQLFISAAHKAPFTRMPPSPTATYPALWNHDADKETRMICQPDTQLITRQGMESRVANAWATASRAHLNRDFTFGSQALAIAFTERESAGGRVWPNISFEDRKHDYAFTIWGNSTLGLLCYWWHSSRQQSSKAGMTIRAAESMPVLDLRELSDDQLATAERIFEEFRDKELKPAFLADADPNRDLLDRRVVMDLLGFDEDTYLAVRRLAQKWCAEPSVHGGKARPRDARPIPGDRPSP